MSRFAVAGLAIPLCAALACAAAPASATPILGATLATYAVLGASDVTCVATCTIGGNLGSDPTAPTSPAANYMFTSGSFQPGTQGTAQTELDAAILAVNAGSADFVIADGDLDTYQSNNGSVMAPGVYDVGFKAINLAGDLILDGGGSNIAVWKFRFDSSLITSTTSNVSVQNVGDGSGVGIYWTTGSGATINGPTFAGNVLAHSFISSDGSLTLSCGRLLAATENVTLIMDTISITGCMNDSNGYDQAGANGNGNGNGNGTTVPEPGALAIFAFGLAGLGFARRRRAA